MPPKKKKPYQSKGRVFSLGSVSKTPDKKKIQNLLSYSKKNYTKKYTAKLVQRVKALKKQYKEDYKSIREKTKLFQARKENILTGTRKNFRDARTGKRVKGKQVSTKVFKSIQSKVVEKLSSVRNISISKAYEIVTKHTKNLTLYQLIRKYNLS